MLLVYATPTARTGDLLIDIDNAFWGVLHRKGLSEDITMSVAKHHQMIFLGIIHRYAHYLFVAASLFKKMK